MCASYSCKELCNEEEPVPNLSSLPTEQHHRMTDGTIHPIQVGLRMVEEFRWRCKEAVEADPLKAVAIVYEAELSKIKTQLAGTNDLEEFSALCPTLLSMSPSLYRYLSRSSSSSPSSLCSLKISDAFQLALRLHSSYSRDPSRVHPRHQVLFCKIFEASLAEFMLILSDSPGMPEKN